MYCYFNGTTHYFNEAPSQEQYKKGQQKSQVPLADDFLVQLTNWK